MGGPKIPFQFGRTDDADGANCPANGRLPDAAQGAQHLRDVFYRMGFNDQEIVVLSGAHTFGSCHKLRSGFDGPWTTNPLKFDNEYFTNLLNLEWKPRIWDGPMQFQDPSGELMMLPTDMALIEDEVFLAWVKKYAVDEEAFKADFATTFAKLLSLGCPAAAQYDAVKEAAPHTPEKGYRDCAMHGSVEQMQAIVTEHAGLDVNSVESGSGRTAMHKASLFGHAHVIEYLLQSGATADPIDAEGDTPLHDAAKYGHAAVVEALIKGGADKSIADKEGKTPADLAKVNGKDIIVDMLA
jgi:hypothetical protein